jgi:hypothetical protein
MNSRTEQIARLNDQLRATFLTGKVVLTEGIASLEECQRLEVMRGVRSYNTFDEGNDPNGERDFGAFDVVGIGKVFWKIDYYDLAYEGLSEDACDPAITNRVLTIMLACEY